jgi:hypothetical protein
LSDALKSGVPYEEFQAAQVRFIACCSPKLGFFDTSMQITLQPTGEEAVF